MSNSLDPDQARHFVGPDLGPNCLQRLSADETSSLTSKGYINISKKIGKDQESIQSHRIPIKNSTTSQLEITNESQEVSPFPSGDHKASINRRARKHRNNINDPQKKHRLGTVSKPRYERIVTSWSLSIQLLFSFFLSVRPSILTQLVHPLIEYTVNLDILTLNTK